LTPAEGKGKEIAEGVLADLEKLGYNQKSSQERMQGMDTQELLKRYQAGERDFILVSLPQADLHAADLYHANLSGADLRRADLRDANLTGARLRRTDLAWADLRGANLAGANLSRADLHQADLRGADLNHANLEESNVTDEQLAQAVSLSGAILPDGTTHK
jgi:uncharacterized protein YjbI with pentapeptide repeats